MQKGAKNAYIEYWLVKNICRGERAIVRPVEFNLTILA